MHPRWLFGISSINSAIRFFGPNLFSKVLRSKWLVSLVSCKFVTIPTSSVDQKSKLPFRILPTPTGPDFTRKVVAQNSKNHGERFGSFIHSQL